MDFLKLTTRVAFTADRGRDRGRDRLIQRTRYSLDYERVISREFRRQGEDVENMAYIQ